MPNLFGGAGRRTVELAGAELVEYDLVTGFTGSGSAGRGAFGCGVGFSAAVPPQTYSLSASKSSKRRLRLRLLDPPDERRRSAIFL